MRQSLIKWLQHRIGIPANLRTALASHPGIGAKMPEASRSIAADSVVRWNTLGNNNGASSRRKLGHLVGWQRAAGCYSGTKIHRPEYAAIERLQVTEDWQCDISEIDGFTSSKSELTSFSNTDDMVKTDCPWLIDSFDIAKLDENLSWKEIRIRHCERGSDHFMRFAWDGRLFLSNHGGSRHLAAAKCIATRLGHPVPLRGRLRTYSLNSDAIGSLSRDFEMFVMGDSSERRNAIHDAFEAFEVTWYHHEMPQQLGARWAVLLPRTCARAMKAAKELRAAGAPDLNVILLDLLEKQRANMAKWSR